jgi:apolipoprotein D and lipocalin family protein
MDRRVLLMLPVLAACAGGPPAGVVAVPWDADRYLGKWYEIARLDQPFQKGLEQVTAEYSRNPDGSIRVVNRGLESATGRFREATARATFMRDPGTASLSVAFFPPFSGGYHVIRLAEDYSIALVTGNDNSYLWLLARTPTLPQATVDEWLAFARARGFAVDRMVRDQPRA